MKFFVVNVITIALMAPSANAGEAYTRDLQAHGNLHGKYKECAQVENKLGQLLFIFTDGKGSHPPRAIHSDYIKAIKELNIGGIRLDGNSQSKWTMEMARKDIKEIQSDASPPVFISADWGFVDVNTGFGLGTYSGFFGGIGSNTPKECVERRSYLQAFLHNALNVNVALGPVVDPSNKDKKMPEYWGFLSKARPEKVAEFGGPLIDDFNHFGVATTLKHFPYTPVYIDPHQQNENVPDSLEKVEEDTRAFKLLLARPVHSDFVMTTHLYNSNVDDTIATMSPKWIQMLRNDIGFKGIIVSDGQHMMGAFNKEDRKQFLSRWKGSVAGQISDSGITAALTILAGHDMIFIDDDLKETKKVFKELHAIACQDDGTGKLLRNRIFESYERIIAYKNKNAERLTKESDAPLELAREAVKLYNDMSDNKNNSCTDDDRFNSLKIKIESTVFPDAKSAVPERRIQSL